MSGTQSVTIGSGAYDVYASLDDATAYFAAYFGETWSSLTDDQKKRALVTATRTLDRQDWVGEKTDADQPLDWPRTGTGVDGVIDDTVPQDIVYACLELAQLIGAGSDVQNVANQSQKLASVGAGSAQVSWFRGAEGALAEARFPQIVQELVRKYLKGSTPALAGAISHGTCGESVTDADFGFSEGM